MPTTCNPQQQAHTLLVIGGTGTTGRSALQGLLLPASRRHPSPPAQPPAHRVLALTRHAASPAAAALAAQGVQPVGCDLDGDPAALERALEDVDTVYCHALSTDAKVADPSEVARARRLARAAAAAGVSLIVYNSSAGRGCGYGISQMDQKHQVEDILAASGVPLTALRATMFMEEFWKRHTRPAIVRGTFPFSLPPDKKLQLVAARDMGLVLGHVLRAPEEFKGQALDLAGDELTPVEMAEAFTRARRAYDASAVITKPVAHQRIPGLMLRLVSADLHRISRFLSERGYGADVAAVRRRFPGMLTFARFLEATRWGDAGRMYEQGVAYDAGVLAGMAEEEGNEGGDEEGGQGGGPGGGVQQRLSEGKQDKDVGWWVAPLWEMLVSHGGMPVAGWNGW